MEQRDRELLSLLTEAVEALVREEIRESGGISPRQGPWDAPATRRRRLEMILARLDELRDQAPNA